MNDLLINSKNDSEVLAELIENASPTALEFIKSGEFKKEILRIEKTYKLTEDESRVIQEQSIAFLLGAVRLDPSTTTLMMGLSKRDSDAISKITSDIKNSIYIKRGEVAQTETSSIENWQKDIKKPE